MVLSCTTASFSGLVALCQPDDSWVARWLRITRKSRGLYAIDVSGELPTGIAQELKRMGVTQR